MENAKILLKEFAAEVLSGDFNNLKHFDFKTLKDSGKYGCPDRNFDCDDTNIMRAVYVLLWGEHLPWLNSGNVGNGKQYRGETMNTFHTMFGREIPEKPGYFAGLEKYSPTEEFREKVRHFGKICIMIGNYTVLPNWYANGTTLNCYRGTNHWRDFFDRFLIQLQKVLTDSPGQDETLKELVRVNDFCFRNFKGAEEFRSYTEIMLWNDYCDPANGNPRIIYSMNYHWMNENDPEKYFRDAALYLEKAEKIIRHRTDLICCLLEEKLKPDGLHT